MKLELKKFGDILVSRPAGREAALVAKAYALPQNYHETLDLDFTGVAVMTPSWLDEFVNTLKQTLSCPIKFMASQNLTVIESISTISESEPHSPQK